MKASFASVAVGMALLSSASGIELDLTSKTSVDNALATIAHDMMSYYKGNQTGQVPGLLPGPCSSDDCYYWWMAGGMWGTMIDYYQYTGDATYQKTVMQALAFQIGPDKNYNPPNQSSSIVSEDSVFWALAAMDAVDAGVPNVNDGVTPSWLNLAENVFNDHALAWDTTSCGGGLRWAIYPFQNGYNLKTSISTGVFFQLAARLAAHTGNATYATWAGKAYDWMAGSALMEVQDGKLYIWDNVETGECTATQHFAWTYNYGTMMVGAAVMYNQTNGNSTWRDRVAKILDGTTNLFFPTKYGGDIMVETTCEPDSECNTDQTSFKAYTARWMGMTSVLAPFTAAQITPKLAASAKAAARQCSGGDNGRMCGAQWYSDKWDGTTGVGQQMGALAVIGATRINSNMAVQKSGATNTSSSSSPSSSPTSPAKQSFNGSPSLSSKSKVADVLLACAVGLLMHSLV